MALGFDWLFFVTTVCERRKPVFRNHDAANLMMETLCRYQKEDKFLLHAFVIMPDHLHLLIVPQETISLEKAMQFIKGGFSFRYGKVSKVANIWQRSFTHERIKDEADLQCRRRYIENNPIRARLVNDPAAYPYSSAYSGSAAANAGSE